MVLKTSRVAVGRTNASKSARPKDEREPPRPPTRKGNNENYVNTVTQSKLGTLNPKATSMEASNRTGRSTAKHSGSTQRNKMAHLSSGAANIGLDTQRIAYELEWDDQQLDEAVMSTARLNRAKAFASQNFVKNELHPLTVKLTPGLQNLTQKEMIDLITNSKAFAKQLRELKYKNRILAGGSSSAVSECLNLSHLESLGDHVLEQLDTKPYAGAKSLKELKYRRNLENNLAGTLWLEKDASNARPRINFGRVNAFFRDSYFSA